MPSPHTPPPAAPPPPSRPLSLAGLFRLRPSPPRGRVALHSALSVGIPVLICWAAGDLKAGLITTIGAFTAVYALGRPYRYKAMVLAAVALAFALFAVTGVWTQHHAALTIPVMAVLAMAATFLCHALKIGPPGAYMFALACAIGTAIPTGTLSLGAIAWLVLAGGAVAWLLQMSAALFWFRAPEAETVAAAAKAVALLAEATPATRDQRCHQAAQALHLSWTVLVSMQPDHAPDPALASLRATNRALHLLFAGCVGAGAPHPETAARARALGAAALRPAPAETRPHLPTLPLGHLALGQALRANAQRSSPALHAALRVGLAVAAAGGLGAVLGLERVYWAMAAAVLVLHEGAAWTRALQLGIERALGTLLGLGLTAAILAIHPTGLGLVLVLMALQFTIDMLVPRNYALAAIFITAIALMVGTGGGLAPHPAHLLWLRGEETLVGCLTGLGVYTLTARRPAKRSLTDELARTLAGIRAVLAWVATQPPTSPGALQTRRDLQLSLFSLATRFDTELGGLPARRDHARQLWPVSIALQRMGYQILAKCWEWEAAPQDRFSSLPSQAELAQLDTSLGKISEALRGGAEPMTPDLPGFLSAELASLRQALTQAAAPMEDGSTTG
ncbi:FUSC family protein [Acidocella sp.]|uniref:FUSC family protein n=1 Tax=Acidocella sp. TaxID=50710 RepID=UPI00260D800F|nr:FUSC family protein [Acidocella sp.]